MSAFPTRPSRPYSSPVADQATETLTQEQLDTQLLRQTSGPGRRGATLRTRARERITDQHLSAAESNPWLAECLVLSEEAHSLGTLSTYHNWRTRHAVASPADIGVFAPEVFSVPSAHHAGVEYRVTYDATRRHETPRGGYACTCPAGQFAAPCHHVGAAHDFLRGVRLAVGPSAAEAQLRYDMLVEDIERLEESEIREGLRLALDLSVRGGSSNYRVDDDDSETDC